MSVNLVPRGWRELGELGPVMAISGPAAVARSCRSET